MGIVAPFLPHCPWQRPRSAKLRKKPRPVATLSSAWFKRHGPFRAKITKLGGLILEHDEMASIPDWVIFDLICSDVLYFSESARLPERHDFSSWLCRGRAFKFIDRSSFGQRVPVEATQIGIFCRHGGDYVLICGIERVDDARRRPEATKNSQAGG